MREKNRLRKRKVHDLIKKVLVCGKQIFLASKTPDPHLELGYPIDLEMPLDVYWRIKELLRRISYLASAAETGSELLAVQKQVFRLCASYTVDEKSRLWLQERMYE